MRWKVLFAGFAFSLAAGCGSSTEEVDDAATVNAATGSAEETDSDNSAAPSAHATVSSEAEKSPAQVSAATVQQPAAAIHPGKAPYARCAACHLPDGAGIPSTFPPLGENIVMLASSAAGREYLTMAIKSGLVGAMEVQGQQFMGAMPAQHPGLNEAEIADVLNYIVEELNGQKTNPDFTKFTAAETASTFSKHVNVSMSDTLALRNSALEAMEP